MTSVAETVPDRAVESQIRLFTDTFDLVAELPISEINTRRSRQSQNRRSELLDDDHVLRIAESPVSAPPIIVNRIGRGEYLIVDGNHRVAARLLADRETIAAYVIEVDDDTYQLMCLSGNAFNGKPLTDADRMANALGQIARGLPATTAGRIWGIRHDRLQTARREQEGRRKLSDVGVRTLVPPGAAEAFNRLEIDQLRRLAPEINRGVTVQEAVDAVRVITSAPAADRDTEAIRQSGVLADRRATRQAPKTKVKTAMTTSTMRKQLKALLIAVRANKAHLNNSEVRGLISDLAEEVAKHGTTTQSAA